MTSLGEEHLGRVITAQSSAEFEPRLAAWFGHCLSVDNLTILAWRAEGGPDFLYTHSTEQWVHARFENIYRTRAYLLDPFLALDREGAEPGFYRLCDIAPDHFYRTDYYLTYYRDTTILDEIIYLLRLSKDVSVHLCLGRDASSGRRFAVREIELARKFFPIVNALGCRHWKDRIGPAPHSGNDAALRLWEKLKNAHGIELTARQSQTALLILRGHSSASIATHLLISIETVKIFRKQLYARCGISSQAELFSLMMPILLDVS